MNLLNLILKKKPNEAKCMGLFLTEIKKDKTAKEIFIETAVADEYPDFEGFLNLMQKENYIEWENKENKYQIKLTPSFFKSYEPVLKML